MSRVYTGYGRAGSGLAGFKAQPTYFHLSLESIHATPIDFAKLKETVLFIGFIYHSDI